MTVQVSSRGAVGARNRAAAWSVAVLGLLRFVGVRHLVLAWKRSLLAMTGIALGVSVFVAISLCNEKILGSLFSMTRQLMAGADLVVTSPLGGGMEEAVLEQVKGVQGVAHAAPLLERTVFVPRYNTYMLLLGIDLLGDTHFFDAQKPEDLSTLGNPLFLIGTTDHALLTESFARAYGLKPGDTVPIPTPDGQTEFIIQALVEPQGLAAAFGGHLLLLDLGAAQVRMGSTGRIDRILVAVDGGPADPTAVRTRLESVLGPDLVVGRPNELARQTMGTLSGFAAGLQMVSMLALLLGAFLVYNTTTVCLIRRKKENAMLRVVGASAGMIVFSIVAEHAVLGGLGGGIGFVAGAFLAQGSVGFLAENLSRAYLPISVGDTAVSPVHSMILGLGWAMGVGVSVLGSLIPAWKISRVTPLHALRGEPAPGVLFQFQGGRWKLIVLSLVVMTAVQLLTGGTQGFLPAVASILLLLLVLLLLTPWALLGTSLLLQTPLRLWVGITGRLAGDNLRRSLDRSWVNVSSLSIGVCMLVAILCMTESTKSSVMQWLDQTFPADLMISGDGNLAAVTQRPMREEIVSQIRSISGVESVFCYRTLGTSGQGVETIRIRGVDVSGAPEGTGPLVLDGALPEPRAMVERPLVLINDILARERKIGPGSVLPLRTPHGRQEFQVAATIVDYSCDKPLLLLDRGWLKRLWNDELVDGVFLRVKNGASIEEVRRNVYESVGGREQIFIYSGQEMRNEALRVFDQTFLLVKAMEGVALLVAILGIFHTLWSEVMDRAGEISTLRAVGMLASQLRTCFAVESALMGLAAGGLGIAGGLATAYYLIRQMIPAMVGWHISYRAPWGGILAFSGSILLVTVLAGTLACDRITRSVEIRR